MNDIETIEHKTSISAKIDNEGKLIGVDNNILNAMDVIKEHDIYITSADNNSIQKTFSTEEGTDKDGLAVGIAIPTYRKKSWDYLKDVHDYDGGTDNDIYTFMDVCDKLYRFEPLVGPVIDIFVDFAINDFEIITDNEQLKNIFLYLKENLNDFKPTDGYLYAYPKGMITFAKEIAFEWFISGNVFPYSETGNFKVEENNYKLPKKIINLNPRSIKIEREGPMGATKLTYFPGGVNSSNSSSIDATTLNIQNYMSKTGNSSGPSVLDMDKKEIINHKNIYHIKRRVSGFRLWGQPYLTRIFTAVKAKRKLRYLDDATIDGLVNYIIIFKIGSEDKESPFHKPSRQRLEAFKALINNPQASNMVVWPHDVDMILAGPDGKVLEFKDRYETVDKDILRSLGIPLLLLDGTSGQAGSSWISILSIVERLENVRADVANYFEYLAGRIAEANNLTYSQFVINWKPTNLRDEKTIKTMLLSFYDRGLLPKETTLFNSGYDFEEILKQKKDEKKQGIDKYFERPDVPFSPNTNTGKKPLPNDNGRPVDNTKPDKFDNTAKSNVDGLIMSKYKEDLRREIDSLYDKISDVRKIDEKIEGRIFETAVKMKTIANIFIGVEMQSRGIYQELNENLIKCYYDWVDRWLDFIHSTLKEELNTNLLYQRKETVANYVVKGVFTFIKEETNKFCDGTIKAIEYIENFGDLPKIMRIDDKDIKKEDIFSVLKYE